MVANRSCRTVFKAIILITVLILHWELRVVKFTVLYIYMTHITLKPRYKTNWGRICQTFYFTLFFQEQYILHICKGLGLCYLLDSHLGAVYNHRWLLCEVMKQVLLLLQRCLVHMYTAFFFLFFLALPLKKNKNKTTTTTTSVTQQSLN